MNEIMYGINESIRTILVVLGIIGAYPDVKTTNLFVYRSFQNQEIIKVQFRCENVINPSIRDILESGIKLNVLYHARTIMDETAIMEEEITRNISFQNKVFFIDGQEVGGIDLLQNALAATEMTVLTNAHAYAGKTIQTDINIAMNCEAAKEIMSLWGNRPSISLNYTFKEN
jgi:hypothetical protein